MLYKIFRQFIQKISNIISGQKTRSTQNTDHVGGLSFKLKKNQSVDIACYMPETDSMSSDEIANSAEIYANLLLYINEGLLTQDIIKFIRQTINDTNNIQDKLFLENVLLFWSVLHIEHQQKHKTRHNQPVIRPLAAFRSTE